MQKTQTDSSSNKTKAMPVYVTEEQKQKLLAYLDAEGMTFSGLVRKLLREKTNIDL